MSYQVDPPQMSIRTGTELQ